MFNTDEFAIPYPYSGIIASIKRGFRRHQLEIAIKEIEAGNIDNLYFMNLLAATKIIYSVVWLGSHYSSQLLDLVWID